jgi:PTS system fructose-specific IIA component/PTS system nitrogen regulatory IIA component
MRELSGFLKLSFAGENIRTKSSAVTAIVNRLVEAGAIDRALREKIIAAIMQREQLGSTGIGRGAAVPHAKHSEIVNMVGAIAEFPEGVEFDSLDDAPVRTVYLIVSPMDRPGDHLRMLERISRELRHAK